MDDIKAKLAEMEYDPSVQGLLVDKYKQLKRIKLFREVPSKKDVGLSNETTPYDLSTNDCDFLLRFVILFADTQSPFAEEKDIEEKIRSCFRELRIGVKHPIVKEVMEQREMFRAYLFEYFKLIHSIEYETWFSLKMTFHNFNKMLRTPVNISAEEKVITMLRNVAKDIVQIKTQLVDMEFKLFQDKRLLALIKDAAMEESLGGYAEINAEELKEWLDNG